MLNATTASGHHDHLDVNIAIQFPQRLDNLADRVGSLDSGVADSETHGRPACARSSSILSMLAIAFKPVLPLSPRALLRRLQPAPVGLRLAFVAAGRNLVGVVAIVAMLLPRYIRYME